jgi:hypothetical protein
MPSKVLLAAVARHVAIAALVLFTGCRDEVEPVPLFHGEWIDIGGIGRERADTCVGTFDYVDAYAGALAAEFGVDGPIGSYVWYTPEDYDALHPCTDLYPSACAKEGTVHSPFLPHEHEIVHIAHYPAGRGPSALNEGIAVYYSTEIREGRELDVDVLRRRFAAPAAKIPLSEYEMLGRFAGFLIERYGLQAILEVCAVAGDEASGAQLAAVMQSILGASPDELITALGQEPAHCNDFFVYRSKVFACGVAAAAPSLGSFVDGQLEARIEFGCDQPDTVGPFEGGAFHGQIVRTLSLDIPIDGVYVVAAYDETQEEQRVPEDITLVVSQCGPCGDWVRAAADHVWNTPLISGFDAGRYSVEIGLPEGYVGTVRLLVDD